MSQLTMADAYGIAEAPGNTYPFDDHDRELVVEAVKRYWSAGFGCERPKVGDFLLTDPQTGALERIASVLPSGSVQLVRSHGSFHMIWDGSVSFSGGLKSPEGRPLRLLRYREQAGEFWIFHHDHSGAGRGVRFVTDRRVWKFEPATTATAA